MTITAKIIADSISPQGVRLTTFELEYPRIIHAEVMTHRVLSRNAQSSRAIPLSKSLTFETYEPQHWGKNKSGMSSDEPLDEQSKRECQYYWNALVRYTQDFCKRMSDAGLHKQWANRPLEWHSHIKVVVTATEWDNFFWLRIDPDAAQPEVVELATKMQEAMGISQPQLLQPGEWHLPYVTTHQKSRGVGYFLLEEDGDYFEVDLETAKKVSAASCAAVSYRNTPSVEKCLEIWDRLFSGPKPHLSPVEHQAAPMATIPIRDGIEYLKTWEDGITHVTKDGQLWSANFRGWIQLRQVI